MALTGVALGGSLLSPLTAAASPAHDQRSGADQFLDDISNGDRADRSGRTDFADRTDHADRTSHPGRTDYNESDDSDEGDSDDGLDGSGDADGGHSDETGSGYQAHPTGAVAPRATQAATRHSAREVPRRPSSQASGRAARGRPMSSGEEQYRNGCRQGYIVEDCGQFDVPHLLQRGINPYL